MNGLLKRMRPQMSDSIITAIFIILSGGFQDAYTYCIRGGVFANAQTGNIVLMSENLFTGEFSECVRYLVPVLSFLFGTYAAEAIHCKFKTFEKIHWRQIIIVMEILILFAVGFVPQKYNAAANAMVSFVCALQVQTFHKVRGHVYASTMCIGNMRSAVESLYAYFHYKDIRILHKSLVYFSVILIFAVGAGFGRLAVLRFYERSIWFSCGLLAVSFILMLIPSRKES